MSAQTATHTHLLLKLGLVVVAMFGFGFAMVPIYNVMCDITGLNGKTGNAATDDLSALTVDEKRVVTVEFVTGTNQGMDWAFRPDVHKMQIHPGKLYTALFYARNNYGIPMVGQAVPSVAPSNAAAYFRKTECFSFTNQRFEAGEEREMPVRFYIDPRLPRDIHTVTLSYTFFDVTDTARREQDTQTAPKTN